MTRAEVYRKAAERSLISGDGLEYLRITNRRFYEKYFKLGGNFASMDSAEEFCLALCFAASMADAGDL